MNEPIVLFTEIIGPVGHYAGHLVVGQDRDVLHDTPKPGVWLSFGDTVWFLSEAMTLKLRDFCNAALNQDKVDFFTVTLRNEHLTAIQRREDIELGKAPHASRSVSFPSVKMDVLLERQPRTALDAKAPNPGGLAAAGCPVR